MDIYCFLPLFCRGVYFTFSISSSLTQTQACKAPSHTLSFIWEHFFAIYDGYILEKPLTSFSNGTAHCNFCIFLLLIILVWEIKIAQQYVNESSHCTLYCLHSRWLSISGANLYTTKVRNNILFHYCTVRALECFLEYTHTDYMLISRLSTHLKKHLIHQWPITGDL